MYPYANTRRDFLRVLGLGAASFALPRWAGAAQERRDKRAARRPNVVLIFSDDQSALDVNCYGSADLHTPNLDQLARRGTRFTQFYVSSPVCSPSRVSLLTGRYPLRAELSDNAAGHRKEAGMPARQVTIAEMLRPAGYRTACFGKWHLGLAPEMSPIAQGFDEFLGHKEGCIDNYSHFYHWHGPNRHDLWRNDEQTYEFEGQFFPDLVVREAQRFITENKDRPFFLYLPFNVPHYPEQAPRRHRDLYPDMPMPRKSYAAFVSTLDEKIGQVVAKIDELGLREDTIIIFLSDHGHSAEPSAFGGGGNTGPYRGQKFTLWEGGIRVPCIVSWPGHIPENEVRHQPAHSIDWFPTVAALCGARLPDRTLDGKDISPLIASSTQPTPHEVLHWEYAKQWAVRQGDWKLVYNGPRSQHQGRTLEKEEYFLGNLAEDATETGNLAAQYPEIVKRLTALHEAWLEEVVRQ